MTTWNGLLEMALIIGSFVVITVIVSICYCWFYKGQHSPVGRHGRSRETPGTNFTDTEASMSATPRRRPDVIQSGVQPPAAASTAWRPANRSEYHLVPCRIDCKNIAAQSSVVPSAPDFPGNDESIMASGSLQIVSIPQPQSPECQQSLGHPSPSSSLPPPAYSELFPGRK